MSVQVRIHGLPVNMLATNTRHKPSLYSLIYLCPGETFSSPVTGDQEAPCHSSREHQVATYSPTDLAPSCPPSYDQSQGSLKYFPTLRGPRLTVRSFAALLATEQPSGAVSFEINVSASKGQAPLVGATPFNRAPDVQDGYEPDEDDVEEERRRREAAHMLSGGQGQGQGHVLTFEGGVELELRRRSPSPVNSVASTETEASPWEPNQDEQRYSQSSQILKAVQRS